MDEAAELAALEEELRWVRSHTRALDGKLSEAAAFGKLLLDKNAELQQEVEVSKTLRSELSEDGGAVVARRTTLAPEDRLRARRLSTISMDEQDLFALDGGTVGPSMTGRSAVSDKRSGRVDSDFDQLQTEFEREREALLAEQQRIMHRVVTLERDNRILTDEAELSAARHGNASCEHDQESKAEAGKSKASARQLWGLVRKTSQERSRRVGEALLELDMEREAVRDTEEELNAEVDMSEELQARAEALLQEQKEDRAKYRTFVDEVNAMERQLNELQAEASLFRETTPAFSPRRTSKHRRRKSSTFRFFTGEILATARQDDARSSIGASSIRMSMQLSNHSDGEGSEFSDDVETGLVLFELKEELAIAEADARKASALRMECFNARAQAEALSRSLLDAELGFMEAQQKEESESAAAQELAAPEAEGPRLLQSIAELREQLEAATLREQSAAALARESAEQAAAEARRSKRGLDELRDELSCAKWVLERAAADAAELAAAGVAVSDRGSVVARPLEEDSTALANAEGLAALEGRVFKKDFSWLREMPDSAAAKELVRLSQKFRRSLRLCVRLVYAMRGLKTKIEHLQALLGSEGRARLAVEKELVRSRRCLASIRQ